MVQRRVRICPRSVIFLAGILCLVVAMPVRAGNKIEGYYEASVSARKDDGHWNFGSSEENGIPRHYAELSFFSRPNDRLEVYARMRAWSNRDDDRTQESVEYFAPPWYSAEGHIKLSQSKSEFYIFYRENRFYINDDPLLRLVNDGALKNDSFNPQAQGVRYDFWDTDFLGVPNLGGTFFVSDNGSTFSNSIDPRTLDTHTFKVGDNSYVGRLRHKGWGGRLESGAMFVRKDWTDTSDPNWTEQFKYMHNHVYALDLALSPRALTSSGLRLGPLDLEQSRWTVQAAASTAPYEEEVRNFDLDNPRAFAVEVRDIHVDDITFHTWYYDLGEGYRNFSNFEGYNKIKKHAEAIWLVPRKAITAKVVWDAERKRVVDDVGGGLRPSTTWYGELYIEYIRGFKSRFAYKNFHGFDTDLDVNDFRTYPDWFGEISVENFLAKVKLQGRVRDAGTYHQVTAFGFDMAVNLTDHLQGYLRALNVNEKTEARHSIFVQLKYDIGGNSEVYFGYGDAGQSDNLVYAWFVGDTPGSGDNLKDRFNFYVKAWF